MCALRARVRDLKNNQPTNDPKSSIPESGKGRGELDGETSNPVSFTPLPLPDSPIPVSRFRVKGSGIRV